MYRFTQAHWRELLDCLSAKDCGYFELTVYPLDESAYPDYEMGGCTLMLSLQDPRYPRTPHRLHVAVDRSVFQRDAFGFDQEGWCRFAKAAALKLRAAYGYLTLDNAGPDETPYENGFGVYWYEAQPLRPRRCDFLSEVHIQRLGGMSEILTSAPCFLIENLSGDGWQLAYLQLTASLDEFSDGQLLKLREFLGPLLETGRGGPYFGPPLRVLDS